MQDFQNCMQYIFFFFLLGLQEIIFLILQPLPLKNQMDVPFAEKKRFSYTILSK